MYHQDYAIVTISTVAISEYSNRLIEIHITRSAENKVLSTFKTLVNPRCLISQEIAEKTGINQEAVRFEPVFCEVAEQILDMVDGTIIISHDDEFVYRTLRSEFKTIGYKFSSQTLSFSKVAEWTYPNLNSYCIGNLCHHFHISFEQLDRAESRGKATFKIFVLLNEKGLQIGDTTISSNQRLVHHSKMGSLNLSYLDNKPGVYYFKDIDSSILYIGKAVRLRNRVKSHFNSKMEREVNLCAETSKVDFVHTGSNLIAELLESDEIAKHKPQFNIAQKKNTKPFIIVSKENKSGYLQLIIVRKDYSDSVNEVFYNRSSVAEKLMEICSQFNLCPKFCGFHRILGVCNHDDFSYCPQACIGKELIAVYNKRVQAALEFLNSDLKNFAIKLNGRKSGEVGFVLVLDGVYQGIGFVDMNDQIASPQDFQNYLISKTHSYHTTRIIESYIRRPRNKAQIINLHSTIENNNF